MGDTVRSAVLFRGYAHRDPGGVRAWGTDWRKCRASHNRLLDYPGTTDVYLSTYDTPLLEEVKGSYSPVAVHVGPHGGTQKGTLVSGLDLVARSGIGYERIAVCRLDIELKRCPMDLPGYAADKVNFLWKEETPERWARTHEVADAVFLLPGTLLTQFRNGMGEVDDARDGWLHKCYDPVVKYAGADNVTIMDPSCVNSNTSMKENYLYDIVRVWPEKVGVPPPGVKTVTGRRGKIRAAIERTRP